MPYFYHPEIPAAPAGDTTIWQYVSVAELLDLLDCSSLHLTRADHLADPSIDVENQVFLGVLSGMSGEAARRSFDLMHSVQTAVFASRWYASGSTVHREWLQCGGAKSQIAVRSTVKALQASVALVPQKIYVSAMQYMDFATSPMPTGNVFLPAVHTCSTLRDERELRLLMLQTGDTKAFSPGPSGGVDLNIDLRSLITGLRLAPRSAEWLHNLVRSLAERYGATFENTAADLNVLSERQACRFKSTTGCGSCSHTFAPIESLHDVSPAEELCT